MLKLVLKNDNQQLVREIDKVQSIIGKRVMVNERDQFGRTPLFLAVYKQSFELCEILLRSGADTLYRDSFGRTVLHLACLLNSDKKILEVIMLYKMKQDSLRSHT